MRGPSERRSGNSLQRNDDLGCLDKLIAGIGGAASGVTSDGPCGLLIEHLRSARRSLLGAMRDEYSSSLQQAQESVNCIADKNVRMETQKALRNLIAAPAV